MARPGQSSFRRILLSRLLLVSVPILLMGVYITYRKARSALLETARQNVSESAIRKADSISQSIAGLRINLITASNSSQLDATSPQQRLAFLEQLHQQFPTQIECLQLTNVKTKEVELSTCEEDSLANLLPNFPQQQNQAFLEPSNVYVSPILDSITIDSINKPNSRQRNTLLKLFLASPIYDKTGNFNKLLLVRTTLLDPERLTPGSLTGYTVILAEDGTIIAHPFSDRIGKNIAEEEDAERLKSLINGALAGLNTFQHLYYFDKKSGEELLAGYTAIPSPVTNKGNQKWVVLAVTPLEAALSELRAIRRILLTLTFALIGANFLAILYVAFELSLPLEKLRDAALKEDNHRLNSLPQNLRIREFNQLAIAFQEMVNRLRNWAEELEEAWKEAQTSNQLKTEFLATISHELRTPLNGIIGSIRLIKDGFCDDRQEEIEYLQQADNAAIHLLGIINDILDISKIEAGKFSVTLEKVPLKALLSEVTTLQSANIQQRNLTLILPEWPEEEIMIYADPAKLKQVLLNILGNAIKFTQAGQITISAELVSKTPIVTQENPGLASQFKDVIIIIQDTGIGIPRDQQTKLFRPFVMVDGSTTRQFGGTGLGLAISRNLMELMGGNITLFSAGEGQGTTVEVRIPVAQVSPMALRPGNEEWEAKNTQ